MTLLLHQLLVKWEEEHRSPVSLRSCNLKPEDCSPVCRRDSGSSVEGRETGDERRRFTRQATVLLLGEARGLWEQVVLQSKLDSGGGLCGDIWGTTESQTPWVNVL